VREEVRKIMRLSVDIESDFEEGQNPSADHIDERIAEFEKSLEVMKRTRSERLLRELELNLSSSADRPVSRVIRPSRAISLSGRARKNRIKAFGEEGEEIWAHVMEIAYATYFHDSINAEYSYQEFESDNKDLYEAFFPGGKTEVTSEKDEISKRVISNLKETVSMEQMNVLRAHYLSGHSGREAASLNDVPQTTAAAWIRQPRDRFSFALRELSVLAGNLKDAGIRFGHSNKPSKNSGHDAAIELIAPSSLPGFEKKKFIGIKYDELEYEEPERSRLGFTAFQSEQGSRSRNPKWHMPILKDANLYEPTEDDVHLSELTNPLAWNTMMEPDELNFQVIKWANGKVGTYYAYDFQEVWNDRGPTGKYMGGEKFIESLEVPLPSLFDIIRNEWNALSEVRS